MSDEVLTAITITLFAASALVAVLVPLANSFWMWWFARQRAKRQMKENETR